LCVQIKTELRGVDVVCVYDGWSDRFSKQSYLGIVACYVDRRARSVKNRILAVKQLPHSHENIRQCLIDVLCEYGIAENQLVKLVADNGSNLRKSFADADVFECEYHG
jgi:hypothetical protein